MPPSSPRDSQKVKKQEPSIDDSEGERQAAAATTQGFEGEDGACL